MNDEFDFEDDSPGVARRRGAVKLLSVATALLRRRRLVLLFALVGVGLATALILSRGRRYTVATTFIPQTKSATSSLAGFAAQLGVAVSGEGAEQSPSFYVDLVQTRAILGNVVDSGRVIATAAGPRRVSLAEVFGVRATDSLRRRDLTIAALRDATSVGFSQRTGVVRLAVTLPSASMARDVVEQIIREVTRFNLTRRQGQAAAERRFTEERLAEAAVALRQAEGRAQEFLVRNRVYGAPKLQFEYERLNRDVQLKEQLHASLAQAFDRAKIDEVRDTPIITQIEKPEIPSQPDPRGLMRWILVAALVSLVLGASLALFLEYMASHEGDAGTREAFIAARSAAAADMRRPWRLLRRESDAPRSPLI